MANNSCIPQDKKLLAIEEALDRRTNHNGMVEYLVQLQDEDKLEWVQWTKIYCPQLMDGEQANGAPTEPESSSATATAVTSSSASGIIDI